MLAKEVDEDVSMFTEELKAEHANKNELKLVFKDVSNESKLWLKIVHPENIPLMFVAPDVSKDVIG